MKRIECRVYSTCMIALFGNEAWTDTFDLFSFRSKIRPFTILSLKE